MISFVTTRVAAKLFFYIEENAFTMPSIRAKSDENIKAAKLLVTNNLFASSIHCAYYSCLQLSKYVLDVFCKTPYTKQNNNSTGSHTNIIQLLDGDLQNKCNLSHLNYLTNMNKLKKIRKKADYAVGVITPVEAERALVSAKETIIILTTKYGIK